MRPENVVYNTVQGTQYIQQPMLLQQQIPMRLQDYYGLWALAYNLEGIVPPDISEAAAAVWFNLPDMNNETGWLNQNMAEAIRKHLADWYMEGIA